MRFRPLAIVAAVAGLLVGTTSVGASSEHFNPPKHYYLALGDSLAFGFQRDKFLGELVHGTYDPSSFTGYVRDFALDLAPVSPGIQTVNLGCPGETTATFISGGCPFPTQFPPPFPSPFPASLHVPYTGSQQTAALAFLHAHPGQVSPITLDDGANDLTPCLGDPACVSAALVAIGTNLDASIGALRSAAPNSEIIVMEYYNPYFVVAPTSDAVAKALNAVIAQAAAKHGARLADAFTPFNGASTPQAEAASICTLTLMCPGGDVHASDAGYAVIAQQFWAASGYSRLGD